MTNAKELPWHLAISARLPPGKVGVAWVMLSQHHLQVSFICWKCFCRISGPAATATTLPILCKLVADTGKGWINDANQDSNSQLYIQEQKTLEVEKKTAKGLGSWSKVWFLPWYVGLFSHPDPAATSRLMWKVTAVCGTGASRSQPPSWSQEAAQHLQKDWTSLRCRAKCVPPQGSIAMVVPQLSKLWKVMVAKPLGGTFMNTYFHQQR